MECTKRRYVGSRNNLGLNQKVHVERIQHKKNSWKIARRVLYCGSLVELNFKFVLDSRSFLHLFAVAWSVARF